MIEGYDQALENDVVLTMKQGNIAAASRVVEDERAADFFEHEGHRTVVSQRELQVHTDPFLGYTTVDQVGFVVAEMSPYEADLDWSEITEPEEMAPVVALLGKATAKVHCVSDEDSDEDLVDFQTEEAIAEAIGTTSSRSSTTWSTSGSATPTGRAKTMRCSSPPSGRASSTWSARWASGQEQPDLAVGVVDVEVDQADALPGAEREPAVEHRDRGVRRHERRHHV